MNRPRVLFLLSARLATSIPLEIAGHLDADVANVTVVAYYPPNGVPEDSFSGRLIEVGARSRFDLKAWRSLCSLIRGVRPQVLHVNHTFVALLGSLLGRLFRVPVIVVTEHHGHRDLGLGQSLVGTMTAVLCDAVVCNSRYTRKSFRWWERFASRGKRVTIYNGVDLHRISRHRGDPVTARRELGLRPDDLMVGNVARMVRCKDQETLIRAMAAVCQHVPEARLVIVGGGPLREHLQSIEEEVGLYGRVVLTGEVPRERVYEILHALDIFVMSSMAGEGFCNAMVEAMAAGKPVIATRAAALPEVVDGVGRLVPPRSPEALAGEILKLAGLSPEERLSIGRACRKRAEECFSIERTARAYSDLYSHLLARKGR